MNQFSIRLQTLRIFCLYCFYSTITFNQIHNIDVLHILRGYAIFIYIKNNKSNKLSFKEACYKKSHDPNANIFTNSSFGLAPDSFMINNQSPNKLGLVKELQKELDDVPFKVMFTLLVYIMMLSLLWGHGTLGQTSQTGPIWNWKGKSLSLCFFDW